MELGTALAIVAFADQCLKFVSLSPVKMQEPCVCLTGKVR